jgi:hypothetical protein
MTHVINDRSLAEKYSQQLVKYYLLHWEGAYLRKVNKQGVICHQDDFYFLVFKDCTPESAYRSPQVAISFRRMPDESNLPNYAMVTVLATES